MPSPLTLRLEKKTRQRIARIARRMEPALVGEQADRDEDEDRDGVRDRRSQGHATNRRAPRKSEARIGTTRTSLAEFGDSIIIPPPRNIATCPGGTPS